MNTLSKIFNGLRRVAEDVAFEDMEKIIQYCELDVSGADIRKTKGGFFLISNARRSDYDGEVSVFTSDVGGPTIMVGISGGQKLLFSEDEVEPHAQWIRFPAKVGGGYLAQARIGQVTLFAVVESESGETGCIYCTRK